MEIELLWTAASDWKVKFLALAIVGQAYLTVWLYTQMSKARMAAAKAGIITAETYKVVGDEPAELAIHTRAIANQFELPVIFYALVIGAIALGSSSWITVFLAFAFVLARVFHAREMVGENDVLKRRKLFIRSAQVLMLMLLEFAISAFFFAQG